MKGRLAVTGTENFDTTVQKSKLWLKDVMEEMEIDSEHNALAALRSVLHTLRDRLSVAETAKLSAQLPMLLRGLFYEGWSPANKPEKIRHREEFLDRVDARLRGHPEIDPETAVLAVFSVLARRISKGEIEGIRRGLNRDIEALLPRTSGRR